MIVIAEPLAMAELYADFTNERLETELTAWFIGVFSIIRIDQHMFFGGGIFTSTHHWLKQPVDNESSAITQWETKIRFHSTRRYLVHTYMAERLIIG